MKFLTTVALLLASAVFTRGADDPADFQSASMKTHGGYRVILNQEGMGFTLEIVGQEVRSTSNERMFFAVDKRFLQINCVSIEQLTREQPGIPTGEPKKILEAHRNWEADYVSEVFKRKIEVRSEWATLSNDSTALAWQYDVPPHPERNVKKQLYLTTSRSGYVIVIGGTANDEVEEKAVQVMLTRVLTTLKESPHPISISKTREEIIVEARKAEQSPEPGIPTTTPPAKPLPPAKKKPAKG